MVFRQNQAQLSNTLWSILMGGDPAAASALGAAGLEDNVAAQLGLLQHLKQTYPQLVPHLSPEAVLQQLTGGEQTPVIATRTKSQGVQKLMFPGQTTTIVNPNSPGAVGGGGAPVVQVIHVPVTSNGHSIPQPVYKPKSHSSPHFLGMQAYESKQSGQATVESPATMPTTNAGYSPSSNQAQYTNASEIDDGRLPPPEPEEEDEEEEGW